MDERSKRKEFIIKKWRDPKYRGCFSGIATLTKLLNEDFKEDFNREEVIDALRTQPAFINRINRKRTPHNRKYNVQDAFDTWQLDVAFMKKYKKYIGFLLCVDVGSRRMYTRVITNKSALTITNSLKDIIKEECNWFSPQKIITDSGKEFEGELAVFMRKNNIYHSKIRTFVKASIAERYIGIVKQRLFKAMDSLKTKDWPSLLINIVKAINSTGNKAIGGLKPINIKTPHDNIKLRAAVKKSGKEEPTHWYDHIRNQEEYEKNPANVQVGDLVLSNIDKGERFRKGYQWKVKHRIIYFKLLGGNRDRFITISHTQNRYIAASYTRVVTRYIHSYFICGRTTPRSLRILFLTTSLKLV